MDNEKWMIFGAIVVAVIVIEWLRAQAFQNGRLSGIREATLQVSRNCSYRYEVKDEPLPKKVDEALTYMAGALKRGRGTKGKSELYLAGSGMLGDAMGEAAYQKGFDAGRRWSDPSDGERRIDMPLEGWRSVRYCRACAPISIRGPWLAACPAAAVDAGQLTRSNMRH